MISFKVCYFNCNSLCNQMYEFLVFLEASRADIVILSETFLKKRHNLSIPGYDSLRFDAPDDEHGGGIALLIKNGIQYCEIKIPQTQSFPYALGVRVTSINFETVDIIGVYVPNSVATIHRRDFSQLLRLNHQVLIAGDFNAAHPFWNCRAENSRGKSLLNCLNHQNGRVYLHFPDTPTFYPNDCLRCPSTIDLCVTKNVKVLSKPMSIPMLRSDHNPVQLGLDLSVTRTSVHTFDYKNANWGLFQDTLQNEIRNATEPTNEHEVEGCVSQLTNAVKVSENRSVPLKNPTRSDLPPFLKQKITAKNRLRRKYQSECRPVQKLELKSLLRHEEKEIRVLYQQWVQQKTQRSLKNFRNHDTQLFVAANKILKEKQHCPPLVVENRLLLTTEEKVAALAENFEKVHMQNDDLGELQYNTEVIETVEQFFQNEADFEADIEPTTADEVRQVISDMKTRKSPGEDQVKNVVVKNIPTTAILLLVTIFNSALKLAIFPKIWKNGVVVPLLKTGKIASAVTSYRPITLLTTFSKIFEKLIAWRLKREMKQKGILQDEQFGFREGHNTAQAIKNIQKDVKKGFKKGQTTLMALLDIEKAFDTVSHQILIYKMIKNQFSPALIKLIKNYLKERKFQVKMRDVYSEPKDVTAGVPQGSILGPLLFLIYVHDLPAHRHTRVSIFADDMAIRCISKNLQLAEKWLQEHLTAIDNYLRKNKLRLNPTKCEVIQFSNKRSERRPRVELNGSPLSVVQKVKYLGVVLQPNMKFNQHVLHVKKKAGVIKSKLWPLIGNKSKMAVKNKIYLVKTLVRPILTYNLHLLLDMSKSEWRKLEAAQNKPLRVAMGLRPNENDNFRQVTTEELLLRAGVRSLRESALEMNDKFVSDCHGHENFLVRKLNY